MWDDIDLLEQLKTKLLQIAPSHTLSQDELDELQEEMSDGKLFANVLNSLPQTEAFTSVQKKLNETLRKIREARKNDQLHRQAFQNDRAKVAMLTQKGSLATIIKNIQHHEEQREMYRRINWYIKPEQRQKTNFIEVPEQDGWRKVTDDDEMMAF